MFGINNDISVPIVISLIVFIIGGIARLSFVAIVGYFSRYQQRISFRNIIKEISSKSKKKSSHIKDFYDSLNMENVGPWKLKITKVPYLDLVYQQTFSDIFNAFRLLFIFRCNKILRLNAFNKIWSYFELLRLVESNIQIDFNSFGQKFEQYESMYYTHLDKLRKANDDFLEPYRGKKINKIDFDNIEIYNYIVDRSEIIKSWEGTDSSNRRTRNVIMKKLVKPLYQLNLNKSKLVGSRELNNILLDIIFEFEQMENLINVNRHIFNNYLWNYNITSGMLNKCLKLIE